ncbi:calcium-translocating P-type ATPase, PMCA-type [Tenuifilum osseticum]|uniref:calcium-translocating P-type ATPase, PMCA-type n=1 Tax=Tenuifilum osseticum TaxID=3374723 RepID=UPI0034E45447
MSSYKGLTDSEVIQSRNLHGANIITPPPQTPWWKLLLEKFEDPIIKILIVAAIIAIAIGITNGHYLEGVGIIVAILLATIMAFINEYKASKEFELLNNVNDELPVKVIRNGGVTSVPKRDVVVGDIVIVDRGDEIPSDGVLLESVSLIVNESSLTGEPSTNKTSIPTDSFKTTYSPNQVLKGTTVTDGHGIYRTTAVGDSTEIGKTARAATVEVNNPTPLTKQLQKLSEYISSAAFFIAILAFVILTVFDLINPANSYTLEQEYILAVTVIAIIILLAKYWVPSVNAILSWIKLSAKIHLPYPNNTRRQMLVLLASAMLLVLMGLVIAVLLNIDIFNTSVVLDSNLLSHLLSYFMVSMTLIVVAVPEGLSMSVTLSLAYSMRKMTAENNLVRKLQATETMGAATVICTDKTGTLTQNRMQVIEWDFQGDTGSNELPILVKLSLAVNSTAHIDFSHEPYTIVGNPTDGALLLWLYQKGIDYRVLRDGFTTLAQHPFSSEKKYMLTLGQSTDFEGKLLLVKGAPEKVMSMCEPQSLSSSVLEKLRGFQVKALRTIAFAYSKSVVDSIADSDMPQGLTFLGIVGIADPLRDDVPTAISECHMAGIDVKMVTGDNQDTAIAIGKNAGLLASNAEHASISGPDFEKLPDDEALRVLPGIKVMYRARPTDKLRMVSLLQRLHNVVAVTGDGTNDAPALNQADVGLAMGSGTQVAKDASDIILLDDSFSSIVNATRWGRALYQNIQKFLYFQLTINLVAVAIVLTGPFTGFDLPLTVTQMLWVNLIMDTFAALALATEPPHSEVMKKKPRSPHEFILSSAIFRYLITTAVLFYLVLVGLLIYLKHDEGFSDRDLTGFFNVFVLMQFWNLFNARRLFGGVGVFSFSSNKLFVAIATIILLGQFAIVQFGGEVFRTVPLTGKEWLIHIIATMPVLIFGYLAKKIIKI